MNGSDLTQHPRTDPTALLRYRDGIYAVDFLAAAIVHLDFFTWLAGHPSTFEEICGHFDIHPRPADVLLTLCRANGLVEGRDGRWEVSELGREHLVSGSRWSLVPYYRSLAERPVVGDVLRVMRSGRPANWGSDMEEADWHGAMEEEGFAEMFTAAMDCRGVFLGQKLAAGVNLAGRARLLDIGGGSGIYACCVVAAQAGLEGTVLEKRPVDEIARRRIAERGLSGRVAVVTGDMFADEYPTGHDVHLLSNVLHDWDLPEVEAILRKSHASLPPGGLLVAHEAFLDQDKAGPLPVAEYSAILVTITQGRCYGVGEIGRMMEEIGFTKIRHIATGGDRSAIVAERL